MVPKGFEPSKFDGILFVDSRILDQSSMTLCADLGLQCPLQLEDTFSFGHQVWTLAVHMCNAQAGQCLNHTPLLKLCLWVWGYTVITSVCMSIRYILVTLQGVSNKHCLWTFLVIELLSAIWEDSVVKHWKIGSDCVLQVFAVYSCGMVCFGTVLCVAALVWSTVNVLWASAQQIYNKMCNQERLGSTCSSTQYGLTYPPFESLEAVEGTCNQWRLIRLCIYPGWSESSLVAQVL